MADAKRFETWAIVELFGHHQLAGLVTEAEIGGGVFIRVDVPEVNKEGEDVQPGFTKYFGPSAIYGIHPCEEEIARQAAQSLERYRAPVPVVVPAFSRPRPVPALGPGDASEENDFGWDDARS